MLESEKFLRNYSSVLSRWSGRNHSKTWTGCTVALITASNSPISFRRSTSSRSLELKTSSILAVSCMAALEATIDEHLHTTAQGTEQ